MIIQVNECTSEKFNGKELWKQIEGITAEWSSAALKLKDITAESRVFYWVIEIVYYLLLHQSSAKNTKNKLGGPKEVLFEHSLGDW